MRLQRRRFTEPADTRTFPHGKVDVVEMEDHVIGQMTYEPGWRWSVDVKPIAGTESCQYHHIAYTVKGHLRLQMADGTELEVGPGDMFEAPPGHDAWVVGDEPWVGVDFEAMRTYGRSHAVVETTLASILITDIVDSTRRAAELGASAWGDIIAEHNSKASTAIDRQRGRLVKTTGDGVIAIFDGAERAVRAAVSIRGLATVLALELRIAVHSGEVQVSAADVRGIAVHTAARIMSVAAPGEILVSATVMDLVEGSALGFEDAGLHELKGFTGKRQLFRLTSPAA